MKNHCDLHEKNDYKCRDCRVAYSRKYNYENRERLREESRLYHHEHKHERNKARLTNNRLKRYGITEEQFYSRLHNQNWQCAICSGELDKAAHVDHNHDTGRIRGLLCKSCNIGLGHFRDDITKLRAAISYLEYDLQEKDTRIVLPA